MRRARSGRSTRFAITDSSTGCGSVRRISTRVSWGQRPADLASTASVRGIASWSAWCARRKPVRPHSKLDQNFHGLGTHCLLRTADRGPLGYVPSANRRLRPRSARSDNQQTPTVLAMRFDLAEDRRRRSRSPKCRISYLVAERMPRRNGPESAANSELSGDHFG